MHYTQPYTPPKAVAGTTAQPFLRQVGFSTGQLPAVAGLASRGDSLLNSKTKSCQESSALRTSARLGIGLAIGNLAAIRSIRQGCRALPDDADLPPSVCRTRLAGTEVVIIGTAHISAKSGSEVEELISAFEPDCIVVELDEDRINAMFARPDGMSASQMELQLEKTRNGFMKVVSQNEQLPNAEADDHKLIVLGPEPGEVSEMPMRKTWSEPTEDTKWFETAFEKHRYTSHHIKIEPATQLLSYLLSSSLYPRLKHALYQYTGSVKQTGSEFVSAAHCARRLGCPIVLGDVRNSDLFDPMGCLDATHEESLFVRLGGPLVRPGPDSGIDFTKALNHVLETDSEEESLASRGLTPRLWALFLLTHVLPILSAAAYDGYFDGRYTPDALLAGAIGGGFAFLLMEGLAVSILVFLLTAVRDLQLFRALAEAAEASKARRVVLVCGVAHVNGVARRISKTTGSKLHSRQGRYS